jgi:hypothetical protein
MYPETSAESSIKSILFFHLPDFFPDGFVFIFSPFHDGFKTGFIPDVAIKDHFSERIYTIGQKIGLLKFG